MILQPDGPSSPPRRSTSTNTGTAEPSLEARVAVLEADLSAMIADRKWMIRVISSLIFDVSRLEAER